MTPAYWFGNEDCWPSPYLIILTLFVFHITRKMRHNAINVSQMQHNRKPPAPLAVHKA